MRLKQKNSRNTHTYGGRRWGFGLFCSTTVLGALQLLCCGLVPDILHDSSSCAPDPAPPSSRLRGWCSEVAGSQRDAEFCKDAFECSHFIGVADERYLRVVFVGRGQVQTGGCGCFCRLWCDGQCNEILLSQNN